MSAGRLWRIRARYEGARHFYFLNRGRMKRCEAMRAAAREQQAALLTGYAVRIRIYQAGMAVAEVKTKAR